MYSLLDLFNNCLNAKYQKTDTDTSYLFVEEDDTLYIYFEGSASKLDWIHNFMFKKRPYKDMKNPYRVHRGFLKCWKSVEDIIIEKIYEKAYDGSFKWRSIRVVGYSHGGALAMLCHECCWYYRADIYNNIKTIAFDGPRVYGGFYVRKSLKSRWENFILIRNHTDIVTHVPPAIFGYSHVGKLVKIGEKAKYGCVKSHLYQNIRESLEAASFNDTWETSLFS